MGILSVSEMTQSSLPSLPLLKNVSVNVWLKPLLFFPLHFQWSNLFYSATILLYFFSTQALIYEMWNTLSTLYSKIIGGKKWKNQMEGKSYSEFFIFKMKTESRSDKHVEKSYYRKIILQKSIMCHFFQCMKMERNTPLRVTKYSLQLS